MSFYVVLTALGIFLLIALGVLVYFRLFTRLVIEIVDNRHSVGPDSNFVQNAILFAYQPVCKDTSASNVLPSGDGQNSVTAAPVRPFLGILGTFANTFAAHHGVRVIALSRHVWRPAPSKKNGGRANNVDDDDEQDGIYVSEESPLAGPSEEDKDITKAALGAMRHGDSRYIVGVVVSEARNEADLNYPSPLCDQLRAAGFTNFCILPPLRTALRLRYAAGRTWRKSSLSRMATVLAGLRFYGSSREVIRQYNLKPPRSPLIVELYDQHSAVFYLPLMDDLDAIDSRHLTSRLPPELTCPRPPPIPLPSSGGLLGAPPLPYKNMNAIWSPWDPYANEDGQVEGEKNKASKSGSIERV